MARLIRMEKDSKKYHYTCAKCGTNIIAIGRLFQHKVYCLKCYREIKEG